MRLPCTLLRAAGHALTQRGTGQPLFAYLAQAWRNRAQWEVEIVATLWPLSATNLRQTSLIPANQREA